MQLSHGSEVLSMRPRPDGLQIDKILVALDFDEQALRVLEAALCIARSFHAEVFVVHAMTAHASDEVRTKEDLRHRQSCIEAGIQKLKDLMAVRPSFNSLTHHEIAATESPFNLIEHLVATEKIDLIIVGSHGASGLERLTDGSFAEGLVRRASCPTLVVGPRAIVFGNPFQRVLLATDLGESCASATSYAAAIAVHSQGELYALHVIRRSNAPILSQAPVDEETFARRRMRSDLPPRITSLCTVGLIARHGVPEDVIVEMAAEFAAGVIVTGVSEGMLHDEHAPWSTFADIVRLAACPVLAVPKGFAMKARSSAEASALTIPS